MQNLALLFTLSIGAAAATATTVQAGWGPTPEWCAVRHNPAYCDGITNDPAAIDACDGLVGQEFRSINSYEVGLGPEGPILGHWTLSFRDDGTVQHEFSDASTNQSYTCSGPEGLLRAGESATAVGNYFYVDGLLIWDGRWYQIH